MNFTIYFIFFMAGCTGVVAGLKFRNSWILYPSIAVTAIFGVMILLTVILIGGIK